MKLWQKRILQGIGCLALFWILVIAILLIVFFIWKWHVGSKINAQIASLKAAGYPTTGEELNAYYPTPPAGQNAADIYQKAFESQKNAGSFNKELLLNIGSFTLLPCDKATEEMLAESRKLLSANAGTLSLVDDAVKLKECRYPIDLSHGYESLLPHLNQTRQLARLLQLDALVAVENGDSQRATQDIFKIFAVAESLDKEPNLISKLVEIACYFAGFNSAQTLLCKGNPDVASLRQLQEKALDIEKTFSMKPGIVGEAGMHAQYAGPDSVERFTKITLGKDGPVKIASASGLMRMNMARMLEDFAKLIDIYSMPLEEELAGARAVQGEVKKASPLYFPYKMFFTSIHNAAERHAMIVTQFRAMRVAIAAELFRRDKGRLPESLNSLVPKYIDAIPADPFNGGKPLKYIKGELDCGPMPNDDTQSVIRNGAAIYGVGKDGVDNSAQDCLSPTSPDVCFILLGK